MRKDAYTAMRRGFASFIVPLLQGTPDRDVIPLCYYHASNPTASTNLDCNVCDTRLSKYGSALLLHLLHTIREVLVSCTSFVLRVNQDHRLRILQVTQWRVTPVCSVWIAGGEPACMLMEDDDFRFRHFLKTSLFRSKETGHSWTYEPSGTAMVARSPAFGISNVNCNVGPRSLVPFICGFPR